VTPPVLRPETRQQGGPFESGVLSPESWDKTVIKAESGTHRKAGGRAAEEWPDSSGGMPPSKRETRAGKEEPFRTAGGRAARGRCSNSAVRPNYAIGANWTLGVGDC